MTNKTGTIIIISGPSGVGKGTLIKEILDDRPNCVLAISATTRTPRSGEIQGQNYYFLTKEEFQTHISKNEFLEWCQVHDHQYGTLKSEVVAHIENNRNVLIEIDVQGAKKIKASGLSTLSIFISPPDTDSLIDRLQNRNTEKGADMKKRIKTAQNEMTHTSEYDFTVVNDNLLEAVHKVKNIINSSIN